MIRAYITNIPKNTTVSSANEGGLLAELFGVLDRSKLLDHYDSVLGIDTPASQSKDNSTFVCDINNGIFEAQTVEQHQALMNHLHLLESCGRLKPKTTTALSQSSETAHVGPLTTSTAEISKEDLMEELIREVKLKYHGGLPLDLMSALHLYCTYMDREPSVDEISRIKKLTVFLADRQLHEYSYDDFLIYQNDEIKRLNPRTIDERLALVRRIYSKLIGRGAYKGENPLESWKPSISVHSRKSKAKEDIASIERVVSVYGSSEFAEFGTTHKSFYLIMMIATVTGMRISSICRLTSQDLIESFDGIHVISIAGDKTKAGTRLVPLPSVLFETVKKYLNENKTFDIKCRGTKGFSDAIKKLKDEFFSLNSGFNKEQLNPHGLRASLNNYLIASEVDEAYRCSLLGHKITSPNNKYYGVPITSSILVGGLKGTQGLILKKLNFDPSLIFDNCKQNSIIKKPLTILM